MSTPALMAPCDMTRDKGRIELILGPMFSGKTTELIRRITRFRFANFKCVVFKYIGDVRYCSNGVATHDDRALSAISCGRLQTHREAAQLHDVIGIDEGQFFPDVVQFSEQMANQGKVVVVAALDGTFQRTGFGNFLELVPLAESVVKLHAVCMSCFNIAGFTKRMSGEKAVEVIGGVDKYMAVCRECYHMEARHTRTPNRSPLKPLQGHSPRKSTIQVPHQSLPKMIDL